MGKRMPNRWQRLRAQQPTALASGKACGRLADRFGQAQQTTPDTTRWAAFEKHAAAVAEQQDACSSVPAVLFSVSACGSSACLPSRQATQTGCSGQASQQACCEGKSSLRDPSCLACRLRCRFPGAALRPAPTSRVPAAPVNAATATPKQRASTRLTLPSRIAARRPKAKTLIAAAVERPIPGKPAVLDGIGRELPGALGNDGFRAAMQIAGPRIIAESGPQFEDASSSRHKFPPLKTTSYEAFSASVKGLTLHFSSIL
jgi:hypothetical protein